MQLAKTFMKSKTQPPLSEFDPPKRPAELARKFQRIPTDQTLNARFSRVAALMSCYTYKHIHWAIGAYTLREILGAG